MYVQVPTFLTNPESSDIVNACDLVFGVERILLCVS